MQSFGTVIAVLDAFVLFPASLRDTLLRLAETPRMYMPRWSNEIWAEVSRNLTLKHDLTSQKTEHLVSQVRRHFPECWIEDYQHLIQLIKNDPKDRHVAAAAVKCSAHVIVTFNLKDFTKEELLPWDLEAQHPDDFLLGQYHLSSSMVISKLELQAADINFSLSDLLRRLANSVPLFADTVARELDIEI